ncbi:hypothetical protein NG798_00620 [Ancylothrix sp. C2]|uniref:hypothetical protein n=1 Tax=Ancylothrix sp. D3o TaxID=2953691 RepID=UPI0021BB1D54|nr:hypothetical protein [Ancylothrix sp. D3o]MCT7948296.1 hypothetical protein [Ancylothrix sp. D3o]
MINYTTAPPMLFPRIPPSSQPVRNTGSFNPPSSVANQPSGSSFSVSDLSKSQGITSPHRGNNFSFGAKNNLGVERITKSISPRANNLSQLSQFGDEIASGVGKAVSSNIDDVIAKAAGLAGKVGGLVGRVGGALGGIGLGVAIGEGISNFANWVDPAGKQFLDDFNWQTGRPNKPQTEKMTSGFLPGPAINFPTSPAPTKTPLGSPTRFPQSSPTGSPVQSPAGTPAPSPNSSPGTTRSPSSPTSPSPTKPFAPPGIEQPPQPGATPKGQYPAGLGGVNLNVPIWQRLNNLEQQEAKEPDLDPILKAVVGIGVATVTGVTNLIEPIIAATTFASFLIDQVHNVVSGLKLTSAVQIPQTLTSMALIPSTLTSTALMPSTLTSTALMPSTLTSTALMPSTLTSTALLPKTLTSTAVLPKTLTSSAVIPQKLTKTAIIPQLLEAFFENPNQQMEMDFNLGQKELDFEIDLGRKGLEFDINLGNKEIEINIPQGQSSIEMDVDLEPIKKEVEKCRDGHKKSEEECKKTGDNVKKIREKLEIEFPDIEGEGEIVCRDVATSYAFKGKGLKGLQQMIDINMEISKNILNHICNGLQPQQDTIAGALDYALCETDENGDILIQENRYEGIGLVGIQNQINALANLNKYIITEVCKHGGGGAYPVYADPHLEEFPIVRQLTFTLVEVRFYPYQEGSLWHMTIPQPRPGLVWEDFEGFRFWKGSVFGKIIWQNSKVWSGGYFRDEGEARRVLAMMESYSLLEKVGDFRIGTGGRPRKPEVREVRAVRAAIADLNPTTGDPETVLAFVPAER